MSKKAATPTIPLDDKSQRHFEKRWNESMHMKHFGAQIQLGSDDVVRAVINPLLEHHRGGLGTEAANGVVQAGLFDLVVGIVGTLHCGGLRAGTAQLSIQFLRPVIGNKIICEGRLTRAGGNMIFVNSMILDENGRVCSRCDGIVGISHRQDTVPNL